MEDGDVSFGKPEQFDYVLTSLKYSGIERELFPCISPPHSFRDIKRGYIPDSTVTSNKHSSVSG